MSNYITWSALRQYALWTSWEYRNLRYAYFEDKTGRTSYRTTWYACLALVKKFFSMGLAGMFINEHMDKMSVPKVGFTLNIKKNKTQTQKYKTNDILHQDEKSHSHGFMGSTP